MMKRSIRAEREKSFKRELDTYRSVLIERTQASRTMSFLEKQAIFWIESARFLITELEVWDRFKDDAKYDATTRKVQEMLDRLNSLMNQLSNDQQSDGDPKKTE